jgi:hypothetical protein
MHLVSKYFTILLPFPPPPPANICIFISPLGNSAQSLILSHSLHPIFLLFLSILSYNILYLCLLAYCLTALHYLLSSLRFELLLSPDLKFHFTTSRFEAHSISTYIEGPAGDSYSVFHLFPLSSFFTTCQTNQYGKNISLFPYSVLIWSSSKVYTFILTVYRCWIFVKSERRL